MIKTDFYGLSPSRSCRACVSSAKADEPTIRAGIGPEVSDSLSSMLEAASHSTRHERLRNPVTLERTAGIFTSALRG